MEPYIFKTVFNETGSRRMLFDLVALLTLALIAVFVFAGDGNVSADDSLSQIVKGAASVADSRN